MIKMYPIEAITVKLTAYSSKDSTVMSIIMAMIGTTHKGWHKYMEIKNRLTLRI